MSKGTVIIQNVPKNHRRYTAARLVEGELWYMGSWDNRVIAKTACVNYECMDCAGDVCLNCQHLSEDKKHCTEHSTTIPVDAEDEYCCLDFIHKTDNEEEPEPRIISAYDETCEEFVDINGGNE